MRQDGRLITKIVNFLEFKKPKFVSLVDVPANNTAFNIVKNTDNLITSLDEELSAALMKNTIKIQKYVFSKDVFDSAEKVVSYLTEAGYSDFEVSSLDKSFEVLNKELNGLTLLKQDIKISKENGVELYLADVGEAVVKSEETTEPEADPAVEPALEPAVETPEAAPVVEEVFEIEAEAPVEEVVTKFTAAIARASSDEARVSITEKFTAFMKSLAPAAPIVEVEPEVTEVFAKQASVDELTDSLETLKALVKTLESKLSENSETLTKSLSEVETKVEEIDKKAIIMSANLETLGDMAQTSRAGASPNKVEAPAAPMKFPLDNPYTRNTFGISQNFKF
jgi:hypothetical protein